LKRKALKLIKNPALFFRDYLLKKNPLVLNQNNITLGTENIIINSQASNKSQFSPDFPIDAVYTYVDSTNKEWSENLKNFKKPCDKLEAHALEDSRFTSHDEIFFSLTSLEKFAPWIRKIYIITDKQNPKIPKSIESKVKIVDHSEIIPHKYLPTFNSHVIEAYLHNVPGLSENFIYFNDDFFIARALSSSHFFRSNGIASLFVSDKKINEMLIKGRKTATLTACVNCNLILKSEYNVCFNNTLTHTYVPLKKSVYINAHDIFEKEIKEFSQNKFRSSNDLNMATFLVPYMQYILAKSTPETDICSYFNIRSPHAYLHYQNLLIAKQENNLPHSFCANDFSSAEFGNSDYAIKLGSFLAEFYDVKLT